MSHSATQQVNHWARIGRELELSHELRHRDFGAVLAGQCWRGSAGGAVLAGQCWRGSGLTTRCRPVSRLSFAQNGMSASPRRSPSSTWSPSSRAAGRSWTEIDENGDLVVKNASGHP